MSTKPCTTCGAPTASKYRLCRDHNPQRPRVVTDTEAWCPKGAHMVEHTGFAKNQQTCRKCRKDAGYNDRSNFSHGKTCNGCGVRVANTNRGGHCRTCHVAALRSEWSSRHRTYTNVQGYVIVRSQWDHPNANKRGHLLQHVSVMSEILGRPLLPGENVHHKNGVRDDNRPENLELWVSSQPSGQRPEDLLAWAQEIIGRYGVKPSPQLRANEGRA